MQEFRENPKDRKWAKIIPAWVMGSGAIKTAYSRSDSDSLTHRSWIRSSYTLRMPARPNPSVVSIHNRMSGPEPAPDVSYRPSDS